MSLHPILRIVQPSHQQLLIRNSRLLQLPRLTHSTIETLPVGVPAHGDGESAYSAVMDLAASTQHIRRDHKQQQSQRPLSLRVRAMDAGHILLQQ